jgi:NADPH2:quinone reductase
MRKVVCSAFAPLDQLEIVDVAPLQPRPGGVVIDVRAAGVNFVDALFVQGKYQIKPPVPFTPGGEVAGEILAIGDGVEGWAPGDRVLASCGLGGFAAQVSVPATSLVRLPAALGFGQGAALVQSYGTAMFSLTRRTHVHEGEWVLVLGAGGGIGLAMVDVARMLGARVIAAASSDEKLDAARAAGAEATIAYETDDLKTRARELSGGGVDVVVDPVGGRHAEPALRALRFMGRYLVIGFAAGEIPRLPINQVLLHNRTIVGVDWGAWTMQAPQENQTMLAELLELVDAGRLHPTTPAERPLDEVASVLAGLEGRQIAGKVVLIP